VVYAKKPFGGPQKALDYLGRYTHRVAISNDRILNVSQGQVTFQWRDYRAEQKYKSRVMTVSADEFIRDCNANCVNGWSSYKASPTSGLSRSPKMTAS
jgi:hypothetical protein